MSATADRSARAIQRSLFMAAMVIRGFSWASRERGREKSRELREKPLVLELSCERKHGSSVKYAYSPPQGKPKRNQLVLRELSLFLPK